MVHSPHTSLLLLLVSCPHRDGVASEHIQGAARGAITLGSVRQRNGSVSDRPTIDLHQVNQSEEPSSSSNEGTECLQAASVESSSTGGGGSARATTAVEKGWCSVIGIIVVA